MSVYIIDNKGYVAEKEIERGETREKKMVGTQNEERLKIINGSQRQLSWSSKQGSTYPPKVGSHKTIVLISFLNFVLFLSAESTQKKENEEVWREKFSFARNQISTSCVLGFYDSLWFITILCLITIQIMMVLK